jgi:hypothetical protein
VKSRFQNRAFYSCATVCSACPHEVKREMGGRCETKKRSLREFSVNLRRSAWCAWQESNLLPLAPQASALSGELQAQVNARTQFRRGSIAAVATLKAAASRLLTTTSATNTERRQHASATGGRL